MFMVELVVLEEPYEFIEKLLVKIKRYMNLYLVLPEIIWLILDICAQLFCFIILLIFIWLQIPNGYADL